ncbi:MAG TPA: hypothetical protein VHE30_00595 [Polyangiaceae bacterium]|nr:hypothetical protein [Polyangiaceae bacterium]
MPFRERSYLLAVLAIAYGCLGALATAEKPLVPLLALVLLPLWLAEVWRRTRPVRTGERPIDPAALRAARACHFGACLWVAARLGAPGRPAYDALANLGTAVSATAALVSLARLPSEGGLLAPAPGTRSLDAAAFAGLLWGIAVALPGTRALFATSSVLVDPLAIDYATTTAAIGSLLVLVAAATRLRVERRIEIGVADRVGGALAFSLTALSVALPTALTDLASPDRVLPAAVVGAALACSWAATTREPTTVSTALRGVLAIMILGVPTALLVAVAARAFPAHAGPIALVGSAIAIVVGLVARDAAKPLGPEQSRWLDAVVAASRGALQPDPDAAIRAALVALQAAARDPNARPELFRNDPEEVLSVDVAGYLHVTKAQAPERIYALAAGEPERTLRVEVLRALQVRRPDVRPLLAWFEARSAFSATLILDEEGPLGFILLPKGKRTAPMTLEEARAVRLLADRISALFAVSSALARSRERELVATRKAVHLDAERARLEQIIHLSSGRNRGRAELLARRARVGAYSPAARFAIDECERLGRTGEPLFLVCPPGVDPIGWAAIAHGASPGESGPFVVVDGTSSGEHDEERWRDEARSPLALADGGTLVVLDGAALPAGVQDVVARSLGRRHVPDELASSIPPPMIVVTGPETVQALTIGGRLSPALAGRLRGSVELPPIAARAEDLRSLVLSRLAAHGMKRHGQPLGIEAAALAALLEHRFPGNDAELDDVLIRAAELATGPVVTVKDLRAVGFTEIPEPAPTPPPPSVPAEARRRRSRPARSHR